jgi:hypothetical protein
MLQNIIDTVVEDVNRAVVNILPVDNPNTLDKVQQHLEMVILHSFYKHGIFPKSIKTEKGESV